MLIRNNPLNLLNELNNLFEDGLNTRALSRDDTKVEGARWIPSVDIKEDANQFVFHIDVPGVDPKNVEVSMENNVLTIKGTRDETKTDEKENFHRVERVKGSFYRRFTLPNTADSERIKAKSKHGVLEITIDKKTQAVSKKIEVHTEE